MPFWSRDVNFKAKLEQKLCVAKETPEPIFDLADCNLSEVPSGVYAMCRVFRKESNKKTCNDCLERPLVTVAQKTADEMILFLQHNRLSSFRNGGFLKELSFLRVLDLSSNKFSVLPDDISNLSNLEVIDLENNQLKKLPVALSSLKRLNKVNLKSNRFNQFPMVLCSLQSLQTLDISSNYKLKVLPQELCCLIYFQNFTLDASNMNYPPPEICSEGTESILKYLCNESGKDYIPAQDLPLKDCDLMDNLNDISAASSAIYDDSSLIASYRLYQQAKEQKKQDLLQMEELLRETDLFQAKCVNDASKRRQQLLEDVTLEQDKMEREILQIQCKKEKEKQKLLAVLVDIEDHSEQLIEQIMKLSEKNIENILERMEQDRLETEEMFCLQQEELEELRKYEILNSMKSMLEAEEKQRQNEVLKLETVRRLQDSTFDDGSRLQDIMNERAFDQQNLINQIFEEEQFQKEAFEALQIQRDKRHLEIAYQIKLIEDELSKLTLAEINKADLKADFEVNVLAERRVALAQLLSDLLEAKETRESELKKRLIEMEEKRSEEMKDFWLLQFEKLMDKKPPEIADAELNMDQMVRTILLEAGAVIFIPLFAVKSITLTDLLGMTFTDLKKLGILNDSVCAAIIAKCEEYFPPIESKKEKQIAESDDLPSSSVRPEPSAPEEEEEILPRSTLPASAPSLTEMKIFHQTECVICLDKQSTTVFIPCGHVCCCWPCSSELLTCPMCREEVATKCLLTVP